MAHWTEKRISPGSESVKRHQNGKIEYGYVLEPIAELG